MKRLFKDLLLRLWCALSGALVLTVVFYILIYIFVRGKSSVSIDFLFGLPSGMPLGTEGGILPAIVGSMYLTLIAVLFAALLGISTSIYLVFYCNNKKLKEIINLVINMTSGIPSIVLGLFGYTLFVLYLKMGRSTLAGGLTLGIMIYPFITLRIEKALLEVKRDVIYSSYALGISKAYTIFKIVLPQSKGDIVSAITLSGGFAMGAAAPIILTSAVISSPVPRSVFEPSMALPYHLYILMNEGISMEKAYGTAFVLISVLLFINIIAFLYANRRER